MPATTSRPRTGSPSSSPRSDTAPSMRAPCAARALEHMAFLNIKLNAEHDWPWQSGWKLVGPTD